MQKPSHCYILLHITTLSKSLLHITCNYYRLYYFKLLFHYYIIIANSLLHITSWLLFHYYTITAGLLHHYYLIHYYILLHNYYIITLSLLGHYYKITAWLLLHYYLIHYYILLHNYYFITSSLLCHYYICLQYYYILLFVHFHVLLLHHYYQLLQMSLLQNRNYFQLLPLLPLLRITFRGNLEMKASARPGAPGWKEVVPVGRGRSRCTHQGPIRGANGKNVLAF